MSTTIEIPHVVAGRPPRHITINCNASLLMIGRRAVDHRRKIYWCAAKRCLVAARIA